VQGALGEGKKMKSKYPRLCTKCGGEIYPANRTLESNTTVLLCKGCDSKIEFDSIFSCTRCGLGQLKRMGKGKSYRGGVEIHTFVYSCDNCGDNRTYDTDLMDL